MPDVQRLEAQDIQVGDDLIYLGKAYRILKVTPYEGALQEGGGWRIAWSHEDWAVTLIPGQRWWVHRA